jgi:nitrate reductase NapAB chaperone NapD
MVTVGVLVRANLDSVAEVEARLAAIEGVTTLKLEEPGTIGLVIQGQSINDAHDKLCDQVQRVEGVLTAWPVHMQLEPDSTSPATASPSLDIPTPSQGIEDGSE